MLRLSMCLGLKQPSSGVEQSSLSGAELFVCLACREGGSRTEPRDFHKLSKCSTGHAAQTTPFYSDRVLAVQTGLYLTLWLKKALNLSWFSLLSSWDNRPKPLSLACRELAFEIPIFVIGNVFQWQNVYQPCMRP